MAMEIITTQKGGEALIWQGCKFTLNRKMVNGKKYWRCAKRIDSYISAIKHCVVAFDS